MKIKKLAPIENILNTIWVFQASEKMKFLKEMTSVSIMLSEIIYKKKLNHACDSIAWTE